jgi:hypothetical protein
MEEVRRVVNDNFDLEGGIEEKRKAIFNRERD